MTKSVSVHCNNGRGTFESFDKMFAPLFQQSVGFDRIFDTVNQVMRETSECGNYPPYDIVQSNANDYTIRVALAGFSANDIEIKLDNGVLSVKGDKMPVAESDGETKFLHRGIANRKFLHRFQLTDHIVVKNADLKDGMLTIELERELPEALKPRIIDVNTH